MTRAAVGKKKKVIVYTSRKKGNPNTALLIVAAAVIGFYLYSKKASGQTATIEPVIPDPTASTGLPTEANGQPIIPGGGVITTNPTGFNSQIPIYHPSTTPVISVAPTGRSAQATQYLYGLESNITDPKYRAAFEKMTDTEIYYSWRYWSNYLSQNIPLLRQSRVLSTGQWDTTNPGDAATYDAVQAIHNKYGIF